MHFYLSSVHYFLLDIHTRLLREVPSRLCWLCLSPRLLREALSHAVSPLGLLQSRLTYVITALRLLQVSWWVLQTALRLL